jgi:hypothetical protein
MFDFGQDKVLEDYWELLPSQVVFVDLYLTQANEISAGLISFGLDTYYDPAQLEVTPGTEIAIPPWAFGDVDTSIPGEIDMIGGSVFPVMADGDGWIKLGTIELHCIFAPSIDILRTDRARPDPFDNFVDANGTVWDDQIIYTTATINNIPLPGTLLLFGSGLAGLIGLGRRKIIR